MNFLVALFRVAAATALAAGYFVNSSCSNRATLLVSHRDSSDSPWESTAAQGLYGQNSPQTRVSGDLVHVLSGPEFNHSGCHPDFVNAPDSSVWIALLQRGQCSFDIKLNHSFLHNDAHAVIIYNQPGHEMNVMMHADFRRVSVLIDGDVGRFLSDLLDKGGQAVVEIVGDDELNSRQGRWNSVTIIIIAVMSSCAIAANLAVIISVYKMKSRRDARLKFIFGLAVIDLLISLLSPIQTGLLFDILPEALCDSDDNWTTLRCASNVLSRFWNILIYANMFTVLLLTVEILLACLPVKTRCNTLVKLWPKSFLALAWMLSCLPDVAYYCTDSYSFFQYVHSSAANDKPESYCEFLDRYIADTEHRTASLVFTIIFTVSALLLLGLHAGLIWFVCGSKYSHDNPRDKNQERRAVVMTLLFVGSFIISHVVLCVVQFSVAAEGTVESSVVVAVRKFLEDRWPTGGLVVDYTLTGVLGAVLDPLVYWCTTNSARRALLSAKQYCCHTKDANASQQCTGDVSSIGALTTEDAC